MLPSSYFASQTGVVSCLLRRILPEADYHGCREVLVTQIATRADDIQPGCIYIAMHAEGQAHVPLAIQRGASAVITDRFLDDVSSPQVVVSDISSALGRVVHALAGDPSQGMSIIGIGSETGCSAATDFLRFIFQAAGQRCGVDFTSPRPWNSRGVAAATSSMLEQGRQVGILDFAMDELMDRAADGLSLDCALVFEPAVLGSPLRPGGLRAIGRLTRKVRSGGFMAVPCGDTVGDLLLASNPDAIAVTFGLDSGDICGSLEQHDLEGTRFRIRGLDREHVIQLRPVGDATVMAALGAVAIARSYGLSDDAIMSGLESFSPMAGSFGPFGLRRRKSSKSVSKSRRRAQTLRKTA